MVYNPSSLPLLPFLLLGPPQEVVRPSASVVKQLHVSWEAPNNCTLQYEVQSTSTQIGCPSLNNSTSLTSLLFDIPTDCDVRNYNISIVSRDLEGKLSEPIVILPTGIARLCTTKFNINYSFIDIDTDACPRMFTVSFGIVCSNNGTACSTSNISSIPVYSDIKIGNNILPLF